ncbi:MAG: DUF4157 domain-containing protein [Pseudomonadota bacterium]
MRTPAQPTHQRHAEQAANAPAKGRGHGSAADRGAVCNQSMQRARQSLGSGDEHRIAREGMQGSAQPLPHRAQLDRAFGENALEGLRAHHDPQAARACAQLGVNAYTRGDTVVFARPPSLATTAHEAAHALQQRRASTLAPGRGRRGDRHERHADAVAAKVSAGQSAAGVLDKMPSGPTPALQFEEPKKDDEAKVEIPDPDYNNTDLISEVYKDLYGAKFIGFDQGRALEYDPSLALKGTEYSSVYTLLNARLMAGIYGGKFEDYVKTLGPLGISGSKDTVSSVLDLASLGGGVRIADYVGSDLFLKHRLLPALKSPKGFATTAFFLGLAQAVNSGVVAAKHDASKGEEEPDAFADPLWLQHLGLIRGIGMAAATGLPYFKAPGVFGGMGPLSAPSYKGSSDSHPSVPGLPGFELDYQVSGDGQGKKGTVGIPFNVAPLLAPDGADSSKLGKYRGPQLMPWFKYQGTTPTANQAAGGAVDSHYFEGGVLAGGAGHTGLLEGGVRADDRFRAQMLYLRGAYSYSAMEGSPLSEIGLGAGYLNWKPGSKEAKQLADGDSGVGDHRFRITPFLTLGDMLTADDQSLSFNASATTAFGGAAPFYLAMMNAGLGYKQLARDSEGKVDKDALPEWSVSGGFSAARPSWFDPNMPMLYGAQLKGNVGPFFLGTQFHTGQDNLSEAQSKSLGIEEGDRRQFELMFNLGWNFGVMHQRGKIQKD